MLSKKATGVTNQTQNKNRNIAAFQQKKEGERGVRGVLSGEKTVPLSSFTTDLMSKQGQLASAPLPPSNHS